MNLKLAKKVAVESVTEAGKILMKNLEKVKHVSFKAKNDIVTHIDIKSEKLIMKKIKKYFPDHSIFSEEEGLIDKKSDYTWVMDPIDGTINYYYGITPFRVGLCLLKNNFPSKHTHSYL